MKNQITKKKFKAIYKVNLQIHRKKINVILKRQIKQATKSFKAGIKKHSSNRKQQSILVSLAALQLIAIKQASGSILVNLEHYIVNNA